jgi:hypothetical protein
MTSLVQRRTAIERGGKSAVAYLIIGSAWLIYWGIGWVVAPVASGHGWNLVLAIGWLATGLFEFHRYRRRLASLEQDELGSD